MTAVTEVWIVEPLEGKSRAEQKERLVGWRDLFMSEGANSVTIYEGGYGVYVGSWVFCINHASATDFGKAQDKYGVSPESFDEAMGAWQKTPVLKITNAGLLHYMDDLSKES
jgi:hypothetical protein